MRETKTEGEGDKERDRARGRRDKGRDTLSKRGAIHACELRTHLRTSTLVLLSELLMAAISSQRRLHLLSTRGAIWEHSESKNYFHMLSIMP